MILLIVAAVAIARQETDTSAVKAAVTAADSSLSAAVAQGGAGAFLDALAPDAAVLFPDQPIWRGASAARAAFLARYGAPSSLTWNPVHAVVSTDGKMGCTMGYTRFRNARDSISTERRGTYLTCWTRDASGKWRVAGTQLADSPPGVPVLADSATLPGGPHSATVSTGTAPLLAAQRADSMFAAVASGSEGPGPAFAKYSARDARLLGGDEFPRGPDEIAAAFKGFPAERVITWAPARELGAGTGGLAFTVGNAVSGPRPGKAGRSSMNKYFTVWRQEPDGRWLYIFDLGTSRPVNPGLPRRSPAES